MRKTPLARRSPLKASRKPAKATKKPKVTTLKKLLWAECKRIVRARYGNTCYTCGKTGLTGSDWHTAHFIPSSICSAEMRYSLDNLRPGCYRCNINLSGNWPAYEAHLIIDHGRDYPDKLKQKNRDTIGKQYDSLWYEAKLSEYKNL